MGMGGATKREWGKQVKFYPLQKGACKRFSHAEGGYTTSVRVVLTQVLQVLILLEGLGAQKVSTLRKGWGRTKFCCILRGGPAIFPFYRPLRSP